MSTRFSSSLVGNLAAAVAVLLLIVPLGVPAALFEDGELFVGGKNGSMKAVKMDAPCDASTVSGAGLKALIITTSHDKLGDENCTTCKPTGVYGEEFTTPYYVFLDAGADVTLATIRGGPIPVDPTYNNSLVMSTSDKRFWKDPRALQQARNTQSIDAIDTKAFDIIFMAGGWGAAWDLGTSKALGDKISAAYANSSQYLGSVCHGALGFILARKPDGSLVTNGTRMTGVTDRQIDQLGIATITPMHPEDELKKGGALYQCKHGLFTDLLSNDVVTDGRIVTGQNQQGSCQVAQRLLALANDKQ